MKTTRNVLFALLLLGVSAGAASAQLSVGAGVQVGPRGHASVDFGFFYDSLASYGNWIERPSYGWVWTPRDVSASWRPYQAGHWVWSDEGWTWLTDEPYGWATYHYGRWYQDPEIGWAWVPGNDWAPAWVSWQEGNDYVGWAPLPPGANVNASYTPGPDNAPGYDNGPGYDDQGPAYDNGPGYDNGPAYDDNERYESSPVYGGGYGYDGGYGYANYAFGIAPSAYLFVPTRAFLSVDLFDFFVPWVRVSSFFGYTRNCTSYGFYGGHYFNRGIAFEHVRRFYHDVPRYRLAGLDGFRGRGYQVDGNRVAFFRPEVSRSWRGSPMDRATARRSVVTAGQFRNEHPDRQRAFAQTNGQRFQRDDQRVQRDNRQGFSSRQAQGDRGGQRWQQDQATRQRSFDNGRGQVDRQQLNRQWQQNNAQRQQQDFAGRQQRWQQDQASRQRSFDNRSAQPQAGWQRQFAQPQPRQQYQPRQQQYQPRQQVQPQRQAPPQRQQYRNDAGRSNRGEANRGRNNNHGNDHDRHGG